MANVNEVINKISFMEITFSIPFEKENHLVMVTS